MDVVDNQDNSGKKSPRSPIPGTVMKIKKTQAPWLH